MRDIFKQLFRYWRIQRGVLPFYNHFKHIITTIRFLEEETRRCSTKYAYQACYVTDVLIRITLKTVLLVYGITEGKPPVNCKGQEFVLIIMCLR